MKGTAVRSKANGLCAANSFALAVFCREKPLLLDPTVATEFYDLLAESSEFEFATDLKDALRSFLQSKSTDEIQDLLGPILHKLSLQLAQEDFKNTPSVREAYEQELLGAFDLFVDYFCGKKVTRDDTFYPMPEIRNVFETLLIDGDYDRGSRPNAGQLNQLKQKLLARWRGKGVRDPDSLSNYYFTERSKIVSQGNSSSANSSQWASHYELERLTCYWNANLDEEQDVTPQIMLHIHTPSYQLQFGPPGLEIGDQKDPISSAIARELSDRGIGSVISPPNEDKTYFQVSQRLNQEELSLLFAEDRLKNQIIKAVFEDKPSITNIKQLKLKDIPKPTQQELKILFLKGIIDRNGNFPKTPNQEIFIERLSAFSNNAVKNKILNYNQDQNNLIHLHLYHQGAHWDVNPSSSTASSPRYDCEILRSALDYTKPVTEDFREKPQGEILTLIAKIASKTSISSNDADLNQLHLKLTNGSARKIQEELDRHIALHVQQEQKGIGAKLGDKGETEQVARAQHQVIKKYSFFQSSRGSSGSPSASSASPATSSPASRSLSSSS